MKNKTFTSLRPVSNIAKSFRGDIQKARKFNVGEISPTTGMQKQADGSWRFPKGTKATGDYNDPALIAFRAKQMEDEEQRKIRQERAKERARQKERAKKVKPLITKLKNINSELEELYSEKEAILDAQDMEAGVVGGVDSFEAQGLHDEYGKKLNRVDSKIDARKKKRNKIQSQIDGMS